jgi:hypothetical protein
MIKQRRHIRFDTISDVVGYFGSAKEVTGEFPNRGSFMVKNISLGGFNLISNFQPTVGDSYQVLINYNDAKYEFVVNIIFSNILRFQMEPAGILDPGVVFSVGCEIHYHNEAQKNLIMEMIKNNCGYPAPENSTTSTN